MEGCSSRSMWVTGVIKDEIHSATCRNRKKQIRWKVNEGRNDRVISSAEMRRS